MIAAPLQGGRRLEGANLKAQDATRPGIQGIPELEAGSSADPTKN